MLEELGIPLRRATLNQSVKIDYIGNSEIYLLYSFLYAKIIPPDFLNDIKK
jgi:hypothetical protein